MNLLKKHMPIPLLLSSLLSLSIVLAGCSSSLKKPELDPQYVSQTPIATFLRGTTIPGLTDYLNFPELVKAKEEQDPNLDGISEIPRLTTVPSGFFPTFSAGPAEVMVSYSDSQDSTRKFVIYGNISEDPDSLLEDFSEEAFFNREQIGEEYFYILDVADETADHEAYTIRGSWFIHLTGYGMEAAEFKETLAGLELSPLVPDTVE